MQPPDVQFITTSDGVTIAYWSIGSGAPLLITQNFSLSHSELEWTVPSLASLYRSLAEHHRVIRFDVRTAGLSDRRPDLDLDSTALVGDIDAVLGAAEAERATLLAVSTMGPIAIEYAAHHPARVDRLILCDTYPAVSGTAFAKFLDAQAALAEAGEGLTASLWRGVAPDDEIEAVLALHRAGEPDNPIDIALVRSWDSTEFLGAVEAPTLVLFGRSDRGVRLEDAQRLVAGIPDAQMKTIEGTFLPYFGDRGAVLDAISRFLGTEPMQPAADRTPGFATVVFTDLVGSTELVSRLGDEAGRAAVREVEVRIASLAADNGGEVVKNLGDGSMVVFPSTRDALAFGVALQRAMQTLPMDLRIGMAAGEPIREDGDLHGAVVAQASRVTDEGGAGEIVVTDSVRQLALGKGFDFEEAGEATLKGFDEPVRLWNVTGF